MKKAHDEIQNTGEVVVIPVIGQSVNEQGKLESIQLDNLALLC